MKAFPILRVSTAAQVKEDGGLDSQLLYLQHWLEQHPEYTLETVLELDGYSAYTKKHLPLIKKFVSSLPPQSTIVFSEHSRLARMDVEDGHDLLMWIRKQGVSVAFAATNTIISATEKMDAMTYQQVTMMFEVARSESAIKSMRINNSFKLRLERIRDGSFFKTNNLSSWITPDKKTQTYHVSEYDRETIQTVYTKRVNGCSVNTLHQWLTDNRKPFGKMKLWSLGYVTKLLKMTQVKGEYQPVSIYQDKGVTKRKPNGDPIKEYFPRIVSDELFSQVQATFRNSSKGRTSSTVFNYYRGVLKCHVCGGSISIASSKTQGTRLRCEAQKNKSRECNSKSMLFKLVDDRVQDFLSNFDPSSYYAVKRSQDETQLEIDTITENIKKAVDLIDSVGDLPELSDKIKQLKTRREELLQSLLLPKDTPQTPQEINREDTPELYNQAIRDLFKGIYVSRDHFTFKFNDILKQGIPDIHEDYTLDLEFETEDDFKLINANFKL